MKVRKLLAGFLSAAMVLGTMAFPVFAEENEPSSVNVADYNSLQEAVEAVADGGTVNLAENESYSTYNTNYAKGKSLTFVGALDSEGKPNTTWYYGHDGTVNGEGGADYSFEGCENITFKNVKMEDKVKNANYRGFVRVNNLVFENCTFDSRLCYLGYKSTTFKNCVFEDTGDWALWCYTGNTYVFDGCEFNTSNKGAINLYQEDGGVEKTQDITIKDCTFTKTGDIIDKCAIQVAEDYTPHNNIYNINVSNVTINGNYASNETFGKLLLNKSNKKGETLSVTVDGERIFPITVAKIGENEYYEFADAVNAAQAGDVVDLLDGTIVLKDTGVTTVPINKNITITNGTFDITGFVAAHSNSIFDIYGSAEVTFEDVDFTGSNYSSSYGVIYAHETSKVTLNNCNFELDTEKDTAKGGVLKGNYYANDKFVVNNCDFTLKNTSRVFALMTIDMNGGSINATHETTSREHAFRDVYGTIDDATISFDNFQNGIKDTANASLTFTNSTVTSTNMAEYDLQLAGGATVSGVAFVNTNCKAVVSPAVTTFANTAAIGTTYYATLEEALAAAQAGEVITLLDDVEPTLPRQSLLTNAEAIDLNNKTLTLNDYDYYWGPMTFANGTINVKTESFPGTAVFWQRDNEALTFSAVEVNAPRLTGCYLIGSDGNDADINIINDSVINVANPLVAVIASNSTSEITIEESTVNADSTGGHAILANNATVNLEKGAELNADGVACGIYFGANGALNVADDAVVNITNVTGDPDWNANAFGIMLGTSTAYNVADTATVNASIYRAPAADGTNLAEEVKLTFEPTDKQEVYNIYVETKDAEKTINRLSAVQVKFALNNPRMSYTLAPASELGVTLTNDLDDKEAYVFNFNGEDAADATGVKLLIGTVTFGGYGNFNFTVDEKFNNKIKTAQTTDNIVEEYVPRPNPANEKQGTFDIASSAITGAVEEAKRDVKVVIDFNNDITAGNDADYNDMTVTLTGSNGEEWIGYVGSALANDDPDDKVLYFENTAEKAEMTFNVTAGYRYTVVVKGEGYRTARYSTNVDASDDTLVLTFWNNAKADENNNPVLAYIEDGEARSLKDVTFLAGDIAQDNIIDKYDLAAVVSYFGFDNLKTTNPNYVKYDLNRDGKIDADDISYVLVSWGK